MSIARSQCRPYKQVAAPLALLGTPSVVRAQSSGAPTYSFSGFGTLGLVHAREKRADCTNSPWYKPKGAGSANLWRPDVGSHLGLQLDAKFSPEWSALDGVAVVSAQSAAPPLSREPIVSIFPGKTGVSPDGVVLVPIEQAEGSPLRDAFDARYAGKSAAPIKAYWSQRSKIACTGRGARPTAVADGVAVRKKLIENPRAIGYVDQTSGGRRRAGAALAMKGLPGPARKNAGSTCVFFCLSDRADDE